MPNLNNDEYIQALDKIRKQLIDAYPEGKVNNESYVNFKNEISGIYEELYDKRIKSLNDKSDKESSLLLNEIKTDLIDAYTKGKLSDLYYNLLTMKASEYEKNKYGNNRSLEYVCVQDVCMKYEVRQMIRNENPRGSKTIIQKHCGYN